MNAYAMRNSLELRNYNTTITRTAHTTVLSTQKAVLHSNKLSKRAL